MSGRAARRPGPAFTPGLDISSGEYGEVVISKTDGYSAAVARHERLQREVENAAVQNKPDPGCWLLQSLLCDSMVLHRRTLDLVTGQGALKYQLHGRACVEVNHPHGWRDRLILSPRTWTFAARNKSLQVLPEDRRLAARMYRAWFPDLPTGDTWNCILSDAAAWWFDHSTRNEFDHAMRTRPLQPLAREVMARLVSLRPQSTQAVAARAFEHDLFCEPEPGPPVSDDEYHLEMVLTSIRWAESDRGSRAAGRTACLAAIETALAEVRGADAFHALMGLRFVILEGGLEGNGLAPRTLVNYIPPVFMRLYRQLAWMKAVHRPASEMRMVYAELIAATAEGSRAHVGAFLGAFHRYLAILGAEPLLEPLTAGAPRHAPRARMIWAHEQDLALDFIDACAANPQVRLQARLMLILGSLLPLRPADYWSIRFGDVVGTAQLTIHLYTPVADGGPKTRFTRRPFDIRDTKVAKAVLALRNLRASQGARDEERLLGHKDSPEGTYARRATETLLRAAMAWATGDASAGIYDLRHTAITRLENVLAAVASQSREGSDQVMNYILLAYTGHAERRSAEQYIHEFEQRIADLCAHERPAAWVVTDAFAQSLQDLESVDNGMCSTLAPVPKAAVGVPAATSAELTPKERHQVMAHVLSLTPLPSVAALVFVEISAVREQLVDLVQVARESDLLDGDVGDGDQELCLGVGLMKSWHAEAQAAKWQGIKTTLDELQAQGDWLTLERLWRDWRACVCGASLALKNPKSSLRLIAFLRGPGGLPSLQLAVLVSPKGRSMAMRLRSLELQHKEGVVNRKGRPALRLVVGPPGVDAVHAPARALSMLGLHWHMLMAGSAMESQRRVL